MDETYYNSELENFNIISTVPDGACLFSSIHNKNKNINKHDSIDPIDFKITVHKNKDGWKSYTVGSEIKEHLVKILESKR